LFLSKLISSYNGRVIVSGSLEIFSNELYVKSKYENRKFINNLVDWAWKLKGVIEIKKFHHAKKGETEAPKNYYKHRDDIDVEMEVLELINDEWVPYQTDDF
jgi:hypothetical protein